MLTFKRTHFFWSAIALIVLIAVWWIANPVYRSEVYVQAWLLSQTPIGTKRFDAQDFAQKRNWFNPSHQGSDGHTSSDYIRGELGCYGVVFATCVTAFWEFDSNQRLSGIRVWKTTDAP